MDVSATDVADVLATRRVDGPDITHLPEICTAFQINVDTSDQGAYISYCRGLFSLKERDDSGPPHL